jgi:MHS family proline/betaine transporter-like MFS transporter
MTALHRPERSSVDARKRSRDVIWAAAIGNGLVTYDFTVYSFSAAMIGRLFFPSESAFASLLMALLTFGAGFFMRPLGAVVLGHLADRHGRKLGLTVSIACMTLGTGLIAFAPTYAAIGPLAMGWMLGARLLQGFAAGGEIGVASVVLMELSVRERRCYTVSWRAAGQALAALFGALVGAGTSAVLNPEQLHDWGWRLPFVLGMAVGPVGWYLRRRMSEPFAAPASRPTLRALLKEHPQALGFGVLLIAAPTSCIYLLVYYMPTYLVRTLHMSPTLSLLSACLSSLALFIVTPLVARLGDRLGRRKPLQYITLGTSLLLAYPVFLALGLGLPEWLTLLIISSYSAMALSSAAVSTVMMLEAFPRHYRATGMASIYSFGVTLFGGFCPFIVTWLIGVTGSAMAPAWYLLLALAISLYGLLRFPAAVLEEALLVDN